MLYNFDKTEKEIYEELNRLSDQRDEGSTFATGAIAMLDWLNGDEKISPSDS